MQQCDDNMIGFGKIDNEKRFLQALHLNIVNRLLWFWSKFILLLVSFTNLFYFLVHVMSCQRKLSMWNLMFMKWNQERLLQLHIILSVNNQSMIKTDSSHFFFLLHTQMICACEKKSSAERSWTWLSTRLLDLTLTVCLLFYLIVWTRHPCWCGNNLVLRMETKTAAIGWRCYITTS